MRKSRIKKFIVLVLFVLLATNVFATTYVISDYHFEVDGKTQKGVLANLIVSEGKEEFS